jgi:5-methylthioadenosine/S-adenosylhomocysteine deaminase
MSIRLKIIIAVAFVCLPGVSAERADAQGAILIENATVLTMEAGADDLAGADILIKDGRIEAVGAGLEAPDVERIDASGMYVMPGFVDTHSHLWSTTMRGQFRNTDATKYFGINERLAGSMTADDIAIAVYAGALELAEGGVTTTADYFDNVAGPAHGVRARLYYGGPDKTTTRPIDLPHLEALATAPGRAGARVGLGLAWRLPRDLSDEANWAIRHREFETATRIGLPIQVHVSVNPGPIFDALIERDYLGPRLELIHATGATAIQLDAAEKAGASLSLTPVTEHRVGYGLTRLSDYARVTRQGLGIDGNALSGSADMFANMRLAALTQSGADKDETAIAPRALLELATRRGAEALGLGDETGTIAPGKRADLQIIDPSALNMSGFAGGDPAALIVYSARPENVATVIVDGRILKRDGRMVGVDMQAVIGKARASAEGIVRRAGEAE